MTRFARPCGAARLLRARSVQLAAPVVEPRSGVLIPPVGAACEKKPVLAYELFLKYGGEGGLTRFARPCGGSPLTACAVCPTGCASCRTPVGGSHPPGGCRMRKKKPVLAYELFLKYGGEGGLTRFARPCCSSPLAGSRSVQLALPVVEPRSGFSSPRWVPHAKKSPYLRTSSS